MAGPKLDGAGMAKLKTLEEALNRLQRLHGIVEQWALASKRNQPASMFPMNLKRGFPPLASLLKGQFGLIADQIMSLNLASSRGAADAPKIRMLREGVAQIRQALEIAVTRTKEHHTVKEGQPEA